MTDPLQEIKMLCGVLAFYAERLDLLRANARAENGDRNGATYLITGAAYGDIAPWYRVVEPIFAELDRFVRAADRGLCKAALADGDIAANLDRLHQLRAAYEFDAEADQARAILSDRDPGAALARVAGEQAYWSLPQAVRDALAGCRQIAVIGSGALPLTALALAEGTEVQITCIERDRAACDLAMTLAGFSQHRDSVATICADIGDITDLDRYDAVIGTVLLGVDPGSDRHSPKATLIETMLARMRPGAPLFLREPHRLGALFYPSAGITPSPLREVTCLDPETGPDLPYRSSFLVIRARPPAHQDDRSGAVSICQ